MSHQAAVLAAALPPPYPPGLAVHPKDQTHAEHLAQIERDEVSTQASTHWGSDPRMAGLVGLD